MMHDNEFTKFHFFTVSLQCSIELVFILQLLAEIVGYSTVSVESGSFCSTIDIPARITINTIAFMMYVAIHNMAKDNSPYLLFMPASH